jgi:hypothetical protein
MSVPRKEIPPAVGVRSPEIMLKVVVLPAPLGPMMAVTAPVATRSETRDTATRPPNCMVMLSVTSAAPSAVMVGAPTSSRLRRCGPGRAGGRQTCGPYSTGAQGPQPGGAGGRPPRGPDAAERPFSGAYDNFFAEGT